MTCSSERTHFTPTITLLYHTYARRYVFPIRGALLTKGPNEALIIGSSFEFEKYKIDIGVFNDSLLPDRQMDITLFENDFYIRNTSRSSVDFVIDGAPFKLGYCTRLYDNSTIHYQSQQDELCPTVVFDCRISVDFSRTMEEGCSFQVQVIEFCSTEF